MARKNRTRHREYKIDNGEIYRYRDGEKERKQYELDNPFRQEHKGRQGRAISKLAKAKVRYGTDFENEGDAVREIKNNKNVDRGVISGSNVNAFSRHLISTDYVGIISFECNKSRVIEQVYLLICRNNRTLPVEEAYYVKCTNGGEEREIVLTDTINVGKVIEVKSLEKIISDISDIMNRYGLGRLYVYDISDIKMYESNLERNHITKTKDVLKNKLIVVQDYILFTLGSNMIMPLDYILKQNKIVCKDENYNRVSFRAVKLRALFNYLGIDRDSILDFDKDTFEHRMIKYHPHIVDIPLTDNEYIGMKKLIANGNLRAVCSHMIAREDIVKQILNYPKTRNFVSIRIKSSGKQHRYVIIPERDFDDTVRRLRDAGNHVLQYKEFKRNEFEIMELVSVYKVINNEDNKE